MNIQIFETQRIKVDKNFEIIVRDILGSSAEIKFVRHKGGNKQHGQIVVNREELGELITALSSLHNVLEDIEE